MVSAQLKELDAYNLIVRKEHPQVPPRVKYFLSQRVLIIMLVLRCLYEWCYNHIDDL